MRVTADGRQGRAGGGDAGGGDGAERVPPPGPFAPPRGGERRGADGPVPAARVGGTPRTGAPAHADAPAGPGDPLPPRHRRAAHLRAALRRRRERLRADAHADRAYRTAVAVVGTAVTLVGLLMVPLPGPGWLVVFLGLAILGTEFATARRVHRFAHRQVHRWTQWIARRSWGARTGLGVGAALAAGAAVWGYLAWQGVPTWSPEVVTAQLTRLPGL
ncbi:TIGR02611 family protein [Kineococcus sp. G2]|uniref:TIGR02611 family protein n=1 Tax=Kineococcus sp. G2 TaxID=3127484 RepID=UPI00301BAA23